MPPASPCLAMAPPPVPLDGPAPRPAPIFGVCLPTDPGRPQVEAFIRDVYLRRYGAVVRSFMPVLVALHDETGIVAAAGYRSADQSPLFLERYLDAPVETLVARAQDATPDRATIVEVGHLASARAGEGRYVDADIPGVRKDDIHVRVDGNRVQIDAEVREEKEKRDGGKVLRSERYFGTISRAFSLAQDVDDSRVQARYADGVLSLELPKKLAAKGKSIAVQ